MAFRVLFAIMAFFDLDINQMDVKTTFLYSLIDQLVYVEISKNIKSISNQNIVYKLLKVLYSLKQLSCLWYEKLQSFFFKRLRLK